jgi:hypothetical protein
MRNPWAEVLCIVACLIPIRAQKGTAPSGYYPATYQGDTFTGAVDSTNADTQEITLAYTKGSKSQTFVGHLDNACGWLYRDADIALDFRTVSDLPRNSILKVFYLSSTKKVDGKKTTQNSILEIELISLNGKTVPPEKRRPVACTTQKYMVFMAF